MATHHASPGEIVDFASWAHDLPEDKTKTIVKTEVMELARFVIPAGKEIPNHKVTGPIMVQCIQGKIEFSAMGTTQELQGGQMLYLMPEEHYSFKGLEDAVVLLTILFIK
jgi:quercetin dioxygenase-like cupin family protein